MTRRMVLVCSVSAVAICACEVREPVLLFDSCLIPAIEAARAPGKPSDIVCDLRRDTVLVAVPGVKPSTEELVAAGLSSAAAASVERSDIPAPRWCTIDDLSSTTEPPAGADKRLVSRAACVHSSVAIAKVAVVRGRRVSVSLQSSGQDVALTKLAAGR